MRRPPVRPSPTQPNLTQPRNERPLGEPSPVISSRCHQHLDGVALVQLHLERFVDLRQRDPVRHGGQHVHPLLDQEREGLLPVFRFLFKVGLRILKSLWPEILLEP
jgi:hypothetical protein